jgi:hypothetical protein
VHSAYSKTTRAWYGRRSNTFCTTESIQQNRGGQFDCPPSEIGGQSIGD